MFAARARRLAEAARGSLGRGAGLVGHPGARRRADLRGVLLASALAAGISGGCASRETDASRAAWQRAVRGSSVSSGGGATKDGKNAGGLAEGSAWRDLAAFTKTTAEMLSLGLSTAPMKLLVAQLCETPPEETPGVLEPEAVRCPPKPAMDPLGHPLELEIGRRGEVGLVATDLTPKDSLDLLAEAMQQLASTCEAGWTRIANDAHQEFHSCTALSGSMVVVGRVLGEDTGERWQFSLAVLGPG